MKLVNLITILILLAIVSCKKSSPFEKVIVFVMENHSYDNMLGFMDAPIGSLNEKTFCNSYNGTEYCQRKGSDWATIPDPGHAYKDVNQQLYGEREVPGDESAKPTMQGWAENYSSLDGNPQNVFDCYTPEQLPIISTLASEYTVYTNWFCSVPTQTYPNKLFVHAASSAGNLQNDNHRLYTYGYPADLPTIQTQLQEEGYSWKVHYMDWTETLSIYPMNQEKEKIIVDQNFEKFFKDLEDGTLPDYTFLNPRSADDEIYGPANEQHPSEDVRYGEQLMKNVYENFRASQYWENTLLLITWDEHGGFYDHVVPPMGVANPNPEIPSQYDFNFERLGLRVPAVAISPWMKKGIDETQLEHSSIPKTIHQIFDLKSGYLNARETESNFFINENNLSNEMRTDCLKTLPEVPFDKDYLYPNISRDAPTPKLSGGKINFVQTLGSMLVNEGILNMIKFQQIFNSIETDEQAMQFSFEAQAILGYRPVESVHKGFKYLNSQLKQLDIE